MPTNFAKYLSLQEEYPELFVNPTGEAVIEVISDPAQIKKGEKNIKNQLSQEGKPKNWGNIGVLVDDPWFFVIRDLVRFPDGNLGRYIRVVNRKGLRGGTNVVILPTYKGKVLLIEQFRHSLRDWAWELPRGFGESGISAKGNVEKELEEEIGEHSLIDLVYLGETYPNSGILGEKVSYYFVEIDDFEAKSLPNTAHVEGISGIKLFSLNEFKRMILENDLQDSFALNAYLMANLKGLLD